MTTVVNESGIYPVEYKVLVKLDPVEKKTKGGIVIPDDVASKNQRAAMDGTVAAMGAAAFTYEDGRRMADISVGDRVKISRYAGVEAKGRDGCDYRIISDKEVLATLDKVN